MKATITLDMRKKRLRIHKKTLHLLNDPRYVYLCVNPGEKTMAVCAADGPGKDAVRVRTECDCEIYSAGLLYELERLNHEIYDDSTYRIDGAVEPGGMKAEFSILDAVVLDDDISKDRFRRGRHEYK